MIRRPPRQARSIHFQYVPSWPSDSSRGQPLKLGQPSGLWVATGVPADRKFSTTAAAPLGKWSGQSRSATVTPYGLQGRPQWKLPLRNSNAPRWMWSSRKPRTRAVGLDPLNGVPLTFSSISGKAAQPVAGTNAQRGAPEAFAWVRRLSAPTPRPLPLATLTSPTTSPPSVTRQSAAGPGVAAGVTPFSTV